MKENNKPEVLAPAGGTESIYAAVRCGADGIYVGGKSFSARANAVNFSYDELKAAAEYCHIHGVKLYRAMNVAVLDSEAEEFYDEVKRSAEAGIDGLIVQDPGGLLIARAAVPDMPLHGSTQMTVHTPLGAEFAKKLGICRIVPARELTLDEIRKICETGMETEVFVHGAQCMCLSGQCYMSAVIGSRSANRGQCAQACRLPFSAVGKPAEEYALSLKDMSLVRHVDELCDIGVKIGADVPFCIKGGTLLAQSIGDVLHKVKPLRKCFILIAKPDYGVNTGKAYALFDSNGKVHTPDKFGMLCAMQNRDLNEICAKMENVFEQFIEVPNKVDIKEVMRNNGALGVCMSGSGPTVFGIFDEKEKAEKAGNELAAYAKDIAVTTPVNKGCKIIK